MSDSTKIGFRDFVVALVTAVASISGSYFMWSGSVKQADAEMVRTLYEQVQEQQKTIFELQGEVVSLRIQLSKQHEASNILKEFLDASPHATWIKLVVGDGSEIRFVMWHINQAYEDLFNVSLGRYEGKTDFDIWPHQVARRFYENDMLTLSKMDDYCVYEDFTDGPNEIAGKGGYVCKWVITVDGQIAIAGQVIPDKRHK